MYETELGDTWDMIAYKVYGNEMCAGFLMKNNPHLLGTVIFNSGTMVYCPDLPPEEDDLPNWRD